MNNSNIRWAILFALGPVLLSACGRNDPDAMIASAKAYVAKSDNKAAIIELKNALQQKPSSGEARFLLGKSLLNAGDPGSAVLELRKALELKYSEAAVLPVLARAMNIQGQSDELIAQFASKDLGEAEATADFKTSLAAAFLAQGKVDPAEKALSAAFAATPDYLPAKLLQIRLKIWQGDANGGAALVDATIAKHPESSEAWQIKGDLLLSSKADQTGAIEAYRKALSQQGDNLGAHAGILGIYLSRGELAPAQAQFVELKKVQPNHPQTKYFETLLAYENKDFKHAKELVQQLLKFSPNSPKVLHIAGLLELQSKSLLQAEIYLSKALQGAPEQAPVRRLLARTYLRSGQMAKASATIQPLIDKPNPDAESLSLAAEIYLISGDQKKADAFFARAAKLNPEDVRSRTALALSQLKQGNSDVAFKELQLATNADKGITADMALISAHVQRKEFDAALKAADALEKKQPDKAMAAVLKGRLQILQKNVEAGRKDFERAIKIDPVYFPAAASLAALDINQGKPDQARKRFEDILAIDSKNVNALLAVAQLKANAGAKKEEITELLSRAVKLNPDEASPRLLLIEHLLRSNEIKLASTAAQEAVSTLPETPELLSLLGQVQQASGDTNQAITTFNKLVSLQPQSPAVYMRLAEAQLAQKDGDGAAQTLKKALALKPDFLPAQRTLVQIDLAAGRTKAAQSAVKTIQSQRPDQPIGSIFEAEIEAGLKNWDGAANAYKAALDKDKESSGLARKYHSALLAGKKTSEAEKFSAGWIKAHPQDTAFFYYLGDLALNNGEYAVAEGHYLTVKRLAPDSAPALNNIAWLMAKQKKPGALQYAEQANKLQPDQAAFLDTMASILDNENQLDRAIEAEKKAVALQPQASEYRLMLAKLYIKKGQNSLAKGELEQLSKLGEKFKDKDEVNRLLKTL